MVLSSGGTRRMSSSRPGAPGADAAAITAGRRRRRPWLVLLAGAALLAAAGAAAALWHDGSAGTAAAGLAALFASAPRLAEAIRGWGAWGPVGSMLLMVAHSLLPFPAELIAIANGAVFGLGPGVAITWAGAMLGALLGF